VARRAVGFRAWRRPQEGEAISWRRGAEVDVWLGEKHSWYAAEVTDVTKHKKRVEVSFIATSRTKSAKLADVRRTVVWEHGEFASVQGKP